MAPLGCFPFAHLPCVLEELRASGEVHAFLSRSAWCWGTFMTSHQGAHQGWVRGRCEDRAMGPEGRKNLAHRAMLALRRASIWDPSSRAEGARRCCVQWALPGVDLPHWESARREGMVFISRGSGQNRSMYSERVVFA